MVDAWNSRRCEKCGAVRPPDIVIDTHVCDTRSKGFRVYACPGCGRDVVTATSDTEPCPKCVATRALEALPAGMASELEALVRQRNWLHGIQRLRQSPPALDLVEADLVLNFLAARLGVSWRPPVPTLEELKARVASLELRPAAIEAVWDGDTHGWVVDLVAMLPDGDGGFSERGITSIAAEEGDIRLFGGTVPPWPEAERAAALGTAIAAHLGVPFFFGSPDTPALDQPRWKDTGKQPSLVP